MIAVLCFFLLVASVAAQTSLSSEEFKMGIDAGSYDAIIDVRTQEEWDAGHIEGATLALNLASYPDTSVETASPADFAGCETCTLAIYCRSGNRAGTAITMLIAAGFNGTLYNGLGVNQWTAAGYSLVTTNVSAVPPCTSNEVGQCAASAPSAAPSAGGVTVTTLEPEAMKTGIDNGDFDAIIDVRTQEEWDQGHIEGATFAINLAVYGDPTRVTASPADFAGCETCTLLVYCRAGPRAAAAIDVLIAAGFNGTIYNGQGTNQWTDAGYPLVYTDSVTPSCTQSDFGICVAPAVTVTTLQPEAIKNGIDNGDFDAIIDVRRQDEWDEGHIEGATFAIDLAMYGDPTRATASPSDFAGCETCTLLVYCRAGPRAAAAIEILIAAGFNGTIYNGQGTTQWTDAGYPLVFTDSVTPNCTQSDIGTCIALTTAPTVAPTANMTTGDTQESGSIVHAWMPSMAFTVGVLLAVQILI